jgi:hypothetical protein
MNSPPVALFAFNRPQHTYRTLSALVACEGAANTDLIVFVDGPRNEVDSSAVQQVLALFDQQLAFRSVAVHHSTANKGLYRSITEGVATVLLDHPEIIVVEDDLVVMPDFLLYMAEALNKYRDVQQVGCIHGYALPISGLPDFYFLRGGDCWGWATWRDRWDLFRDEPFQLIQELIQRDALDNFMGTQGSSSLRMLCDRALGLNHSWAILWHASLWLADRLTLHPGHSFVQNIGNDGSGTHACAGARFDAVMRSAFSGLNDVSLHQDALAAQRVSAFLDGIDGGLPLATWGWWKRKRDVSLAKRIARLEPTARRAIP